jgi:hypothetical protein
MNIFTREHEPLEPVEDPVPATVIAGRARPPSRDECEAMLSKYRADHRIAEHGRAVADTALRIADLLAERGVALDRGLLGAAAMLHDICKGKHDHAREGGALLRGLGFPGLAAVIESHMDIRVSPDGPIDESQVVFLADKLVLGNVPVSLEERFSAAAKRYGLFPEMRSVMERRMKSALCIKEKIEAAAGSALPAGVRRAASVVE